ncbi:MAG TPA: hypothetical protein VGI67_15230 [Thermoleophilaceae bacterium]
MKDDDWNDLADDDPGELDNEDWVVLPPEERRLLPAFKILYGPAGAVRADLARAHRQMNIAAAVSKRPSDPRRN